MYTSRRGSIEQVYDGNHSYLQQIPWAIKECDERETQQQPPALLNETKITTNWMIYCRDDPFPPIDWHLQLLFWTHWTLYDWITDDKSRVFGVKRWTNENSGIDVWLHGHISLRLLYVYNIYI